MYSAMAGGHMRISQDNSTVETLDAVSEDLASNPSMATWVWESIMNKIWHIVGPQHFTVPFPITGYSAPPIMGQRHQLKL